MSKQLIQVDISKLMSELAKNRDLVDVTRITLANVLLALAEATKEDELTTVDHKG